MQSVQAMLFSIVLLVVGLFVVLRWVVGKSVFERVAAYWLYDISRAVVRFPFRLMGRMFTGIGRLARGGKHRTR